jgi:hypothetical protein
MFYIVTNELKLWIFFVFVKNYCCNFQIIYYSVVDYRLALLLKIERRYMTTNAQQS